MGLPTIPAVIYNITIPGTDRIIKFRPFQVKEYKILLQAKEFGDDNGFVNTVRQIIKDCLLNEVDIDELPIYAIDYIFLMIRAKSVGELIDAEYKCNNIVGEMDDNEPIKCGYQFKVQLNLNDAFVKFPDNFNKKSVIKITDSIGMKLKSPSFSRFRSIEMNEKDVYDITDEFVFACIESVYDGDKVLIPSVDFTLQELKAFLESLTQESIDKISAFFKSQPVISMKLSITCPKCRHVSEIELNGLDDFFD